MHDASSCILGKLRRDYVRTPPPISVNKQMSVCVCHNLRVNLQGQVQECNDGDCVIESIKGGFIYCLTCVHACTVRVCVCVC